MVDMIEETCAKLADVIGKVEPTLATRHVKVELASPPPWATGTVDVRHLLHWTADQTVAVVTVNDALTHAIVDTGASSTVMDVKMARALGVPLQLATGTNCGTYTTPGPHSSTAYAGLIEGPVTLKFNEHV